MERISLTLLKEIQEIFKNNKARKFVMYNAPSQNSALAKKSLKKAKVKVVCIPARSPDLNPIENIQKTTKPGNLLWTMVRARIVH